MLLPGYEAAAAGQLVSMAGNCFTIDDQCVVASDDGEYAFVHWAYCFVAYADNRFSINVCIR